MIILKNQFTLSQAFKSSAIKSQYNNKTMAIITPIVIVFTTDYYSILYKQ